MKIFTKKSMISLLLFAVLVNVVPNFSSTVMAAQSSIFTDDFEGYAVGTTVASEGTAYRTKYNGTGDRNQVVVSTEQKYGTTGNVLQLQGASGWSSQIKYSFTPDDKQYLIVEADIKPIAGKTPARICFCSDSAGGSWVKAVCGITMENGGFVYGRDDKGYPITTDLTYTTGNWYHLSLALDRTNHIFYIFLDGTLIGGTSFAAGSATPGWLELASPYNTAYFDNINLYSADTFNIFTDDLESYAVGTTVASGGTAYTKIYDGTGDSNQVVVSAEQKDGTTGNVLQLQGRNTWASQIKYSFTPDDKQYLIVEADVNPVAGKFPAGISLCSDSVSGTWNHAVCGIAMKNGGFTYRKNDDDYSITTDLTYTTGNWYHLSLALDRTNHKFYTFLDGMLIGGTSFAAVSATPEWLELSSLNDGTNTAYFDNINLYSTDTFNIATVIFNSNGGSEVANQSVIFGEKAEEPTTPTKSGWIFGGWYKDTDCLDIWDFGTDVVTETMTLYAKWDEVHVHNLTLVTAKDATHEADGNIEYYVCSGCDKLFRDANATAEITNEDTVIAKGEHDYGDTYKTDAENHWKECGCGNIIEKAAHTGGEATCIKKAICSVCGVEYGNFADHTFAENTDAKYLKTAATCNSKAVYYKSCSVCGVKNNETFEYGDFDSSKHVGGTYIKDQKEATCYEEGYTGDTYCTGCNAKIVSGTVIEKNAHNPASVWSTDENYHWKDCQTVGCGNIINKVAHSGGEATCVKKAICSVCGVEYGAVAGHKLGKVDAKAATHEADGNIEYYVCSVCGKLFNDANATAEIANEDTVIAKGEHDYGDTYKTDAENHWKECGCGNIIEKAAHTGGEATCIKKAICSVCGVEYGTVAGHKLGKVDAKAATHEADGNIEYYVCSVCGKLFNDANATAEITNEDTVIAKGEHDYGDTYKTDAENHWKECGCGNIIEKAAHSFGDWKVVKEATTAEKGTKEKVCSVCGYKVEESIPAIDKTPEKSPQTGDTSNLALWIVLMFISATGAGTLTVYNRKKRVK